jgi:PAS domain S-box-containing protein
VNFMRGADGRMTGLMGITRDISDRKRAEEALRDNEERFRQITENMLDAVSVVDGNGIMLYASPSHRRILGYRPEDLLGKSVFDFVCPEDVDSVMASLAGIMEKQEARYQFRFRHADGHYVWGEASAKLLLDDAGDASRFVIASRDISDRKAAEEALRNSEAKYKALFDHTLLGMEVIDGQTGKTVLANRSLARMFGFESPADMIGINPLDYVLPEDLEWVTGQIAQLMADPAWNKQTLIRSKTRDGRIIWLTGMTTPFEYEGKPGMLISLIDSTLAKEAEQKLKESEEKNRAIIDNAAEAIVVLQDGMVKFINPKGVELMGRYGEEFTPKPFLEFIHPDDRQMMMENHLKRLAGEEVPNNYTFRMLDKEGNTKWMQINAVRLDWEGKPAVLSLLNDITDQVRTHERLKESEERYRLLAENATDVIWATDLDLTITYVSPAVTSLLGYTVEEAMTGVFLNRLLTPDSMAAMMKQHKTDMAGEEGRPGSWKELTVEIEVVAKDGTKFWLEAAINGVRDGEGELTGFQGACRDVTERRRAEQALMERLKELQCIAGIARLAEKPDMPVEEFVRESVSLLPTAWQHPDVCGARIRLDSKEYATADFRETEWCQSAAIRVDEKQFGLITVCYLKEMPAADEGPFLKEERALVDTVADFMGHVIQHRQMEGSLREAKEYAENIIKTANVLVVMLDVDGNVTELNEAGEKITGYGKGEVLGKNWFKLIAPRERYPRVWEEFTRLQSQGSIVETFENPILTRSGEERFISWKNSPLVLKGRTVGALSFGMDITDRKRAEEDLQKARDELEMRVEQRTAELKKANALLTQEIRQRKVAQDRLEESESRYRGLVESANSIILELDTKGKVAFFNRFAQDFFGFSESEILGRHMVGTIAPPVDFEGKDRKTLTKDLVTHPEDYAAIENDCLLKNGDRVWISWTNKGLYDAKGRLRNVLCVGMDRTEQRRVADLLAQQMREKAAGDERQRLARDLHDAVTQTLFSASLIAEVLPRLWKKDRAEGERRLEELRRLTRGALAEMRMLLLELRPAALAEVGLADLLRQLVEAASIQAKLQVAFVSGGTCTAPPDVQVALYRVAQEALNNVVKHSGAAEAEVKLSSRKGSVDLRITDDGSGFDLREVSPKSLGLRIMQERAESIGATLKIDGRVGHGTKVRVQWSDAERKEA